MKNKEPKTHSTVQVVFNDGEVKNYVISAGPGIGSYLDRDAGATSVLNLYNADESYAIPLANIREWTIVHRPEADASAEEGAS